VAEKEFCVKICSSLSDAAKISGEKSDLVGEETRIIKHN
jgi:hypothetical protein